MKGTEGIIEKILLDAKEKAKGIEDKAVFDSAMAEKATAEWVEEYKSEQTKLLKKECQEVLERKITLASLDRRKILLKVKQEIIDGVLDRALEIMKGLPKTEYLSFILRLIENSADDGDIVVLSRDGVINESDISSAAIFIEKNLSVAQDRGEFVGGVILQGRSSDKDLTFAAILSEERENLVAKITSELFN